MSELLQLKPEVIESPDPIIASSWETEFIYWFIKVVIEIFFREISIRGSFNIPANGPAMVVIAPHANQFLDAGVSMYSVHAATGRLTHFVEAAVSFRQRVIGSLSRMAGSIPVERAQDLLRTKQGLIRFKNYPDDELTIIGRGTHFTVDCQVKSLLGLPHSAGNVKIGEIISDTELKFSTPMKKAGGIKMLQDFVPYKTAPRIDNHKLFDTVFNRLNEGDLIAIAPEGGSHDRTDLLPLKPGVAIMALGAAAKYPGLKIPIVPCGLNYFHAHKFRSRAVLEFGRPIIIDDEWAEKYKEDSKKTVSELMEIITDAMKAVTTQSPDYETLQVIQAARRLYSYGGSRSNIPLPIVVEINRNLLIGYSKFKDDRKIRHLKDSVVRYNERLNYYGLTDHQMENASKDVLHNAILLCKRLVLLAYYTTLSLPGTILFSPVFYACKKISAKKQKEALANSVVKIHANDVLGSWKVMIALVVAPICYFLYSLLGTYLMNKYHLLPSLTGTSLDTLLTFTSSWIILLCTTYASLRLGEDGMDIAKSIRPLVLSLSPETTELKELNAERESLSLEVTQVINELGPKVFPKFNQQRLKELSEEVKEENSTIKKGRGHSGARYHRHHHRHAASSSSSSISGVSTTTSSTESLLSSDGTLVRERAASTSSSVYSGFSEFDMDEEGKGRMPNLSHVSIFPDKLQLSDASSSIDVDLQDLDKSSLESATGSNVHTTAIDLTSRVRDAVFQRNQAGTDNQDKKP
ncbi:hypothetical protein FOA43_004338 [Brettanomyces nanus]|uniref:Phospholipid/glycerol acyltransferase domain-containing protein n=1 Tax=Eeniella nana TaxID=13502 RepID=A0A875SE54_EENNA|nr:uncharacterized protein FOA43_004338 [Brettanomyces nanus]QPG76944.1 hypothetical protein FOA43_004338 [Brettanomyces nanus]